MYCDKCAMPLDRKTGLCSRCDWDYDKMFINQAEPVIFNESDLKTDDISADDLGDTSEIENKKSSPLGTIVTIIIIIYAALSIIPSLLSETGSGVRNTIGLATDRYSNPEGDPQEILAKYFESLDSGNIEVAYNFLSTQSKASINKDDFILKYNLYNQIYKDSTNSITRLREYDDSTIGRNSYKSAVSFKVVNKSTWFYDGKEYYNTYERAVVDDNGIWRVDENGADIRRVIADYYEDLGWAFLYGVGRAKNVNEAANSFNKSIQYDEDFAHSYNGLGFTYYELGNFNKAVDSITMYINKSPEPKNKSKGYSTLGSFYNDKYQYSKALEAYKKALELNPNNENAKQNIPYIEQMLKYRR